ncbi:MAG: hypothetical protein ACRCZF_07230, partial [Gemmataceae bacterium]
GTKWEFLAFTPARAALYALLLLLTSIWLVRQFSRDVAGGVWGVAFGSIVVCTGVMTNVRANRANDLGARIAQVAAALPPGAEIVAVGEVHASVPYHMGRVFRSCKRENAADIVPPGGYFCFEVWIEMPSTTEPPFAYEVIGKISVDRYARPIPECADWVCRRRP